MKRFAWILSGILMLVLQVGYAQIWHDGNGQFTFSGVHMRFEPYVRTRISPYLFYEWDFSQETHSYSDSTVIQYSNQIMDIKLKVTDNKDFGVAAKQVEVSTLYHQEVNILDFSILNAFPNERYEKVFRGPKAIHTQAVANNIMLYPFTDQVMQYKFPDSSLYFAASNFQGTENIEWLKESGVCLYDHTLHFARRYNPDNIQFDTLQDAMKRMPADSDYYSFMVFEREPIILQINRWLGKNQAAVVFTNDADGENALRMKAVYFGSSDESSPKYLTQGFIANNIKVTNTVFGANKPYLGSLWHELMDHGNTIGYHTYAVYSDSSAITYQNLVYDMDEYNIRTWIDHSWGNNTEDICVQGWNPDSGFFILNAINDSKIDYVWLGDASYTNPINSFTEPWRLPHRLYEFDHLHRPVWFYGRTKMNTWENTSHFYLEDMKHMLTAENLDQLLRDNGLCVVYTHFFYNQTASINPHYHILPSGVYEIRDEVNDRLMLLDHYQKEHGLWIDTLEEVFDRMIAINDLKISSISKIPMRDTWLVKLVNESEIPLKELFLKYQEQEYLFSELHAQQEISFAVTEAQDDDDTFVSQRRFRASYKGGELKITELQQRDIPPAKLTFYNIRGQQIYNIQTSYKAKELVIPFAGKASGVYLLKIETADGHSSTVPFTCLK